MGYTNLPGKWQKLQKEAINFYLNIHIHASKKSIGFNFGIPETSTVLWFLTNSITTIKVWRTQQPGSNWLSTE